MGRDRNLRRKIGNLRNDFYNQFAKDIYLMPFWKRIKLAARIVFKTKKITV